MRKQVTNQQILSTCNFSGSPFKALKLAQIFFLQIRLFFFFLLLTSFSAKAQDHVFGWATSVAGEAENYLDEGKAIAVDAAGNVYTTGLFRGTADFDPGTGTNELTSAGESDIFIQKLDANGNLLWAKRIGGTENDAGGAITTDASGYVYITGNFRATVDFGDGTGITSNGEEDFFILKLDAATGDFVWAKTIGGTKGEKAQGISVDDSGNVYTVGSFDTEADFDPGSGTFTLSGKNDDIFILKLDADGNFAWVKGIGGNNGDVANAVAIDASGDVYITGSFNTTASTPADFGDGTDIYAVKNSDIFVLKLMDDGSFLWVKTMGSTGSEFGRSITSDSSGNVYISGDFKGTLDFGSGTGIASVNYDAFVLKLAGDGTFSWVKTMGGTDDDAGNGIGVDDLGNVYTIGYFNGTTDFDPGAGTYNLTAMTTNDDVFIQKLDAGGNFVWAKGIYDSLTGAGLGIAVSTSGDVHVTGSFGGTTDFDPSTADTHNLVSEGSRDIYVLKLVPEETTPVALTAFTATAEANKAKLSWQTASEQNNNHFAIYRSTDGNTFTLIGEKPGAGTSTTPNSYVFYDNQPQNGTNYYRLVQVDNDGKETIEGDRVLSFSLSKISVSVYPNPTKDRINVQFEKGKYTNLSIVGTDGKVLKSINIKDTENAIELDITPYPTGVYLVKLTGSESAIHKVVKQ